jgi:hypothetical protein
MNVLITAALTAQAHKLKQLLTEEATFIYADQDDLPAFMRKENKFVCIPEGSSPSFAHELLTLCLDLQIGYVYPLRREEIIALAEARQLFEEYNIKVVVPAKHIIAHRLPSEPINGNIIVHYNHQNLLSGEQGDFESNLETGVFVASPKDGVLDYYIFTAD